jgi:cytochrome c oxidase cbb3-type subunit I/II
MGALAWNGGLAFAMLYYIVPRIYGTKLFSVKLANLHFWLATTGILFYVIPMYVGGITQSLMWREFTADGFLRYGNFLETVSRIVPMYMIRAAGGTLFLTGGLVAVVNLYLTARGGSLIAEEHAQAPALLPEPGGSRGSWHRVLEEKPLRFAVFTFIAVLIGGIVEYVPTALVKANVPTIASVQPYTPLEIEGRDLYIREGCVGCHSQMIRPMRAETERYGDYSKPGEFVYDHPFLWGSKRTGPDLHRVGGKYPSTWHFLHMKNPSSTSPGSLMPAYTWLFDDRLETSHIEGKVITLRRLGVPYPPGAETSAANDLKVQAERIAAELRAAGQDAQADREIIALIAYLQRLGTDIRPKAAVRADAQSVGGR